MAKRGTFAFELSKPSKRGTLMKQGSLHKAFKYRYFVLYPGFLVYYDTEIKWKVDLAKGETLGNRIGAIKLKNGSVSVARDAPKGCKFGLIVHAPDPVNKRQSYLLNASSKGDRDEWITAVQRAIPTSKSPQQQQKNDKREKETGERKKKESDHHDDHHHHQQQQQQRPAVMRQDTAATAALLDSEDREEEKEETSIDRHLAVNVRHNTADIAALQGSMEKTSEDAGEEEEEEEHGVTAIDDEIIATALGQKHNGRDDSSEDEALSEEPCRQTTPITNGHATPTENSATHDQSVPLEGEGGGEELDTEREVTSSVNLEGAVEVVTSVKVQTRSSSEEEEEEEGEREEGERDGRFKRASAEVAIAEVKAAFTVTMVRDNTIEVQDTDSETDDDCLEDDPAYFPPPPSTDPSPDDPSCNGFPEPSTPTTPVAPATPFITIQKVNTLKKSNGTGTDDMMCKEEEEEAAAKDLKAKTHKRTYSAPFIEKKGFLYKEGGQRKTWKLRYFVLQPGMFTYYKNSTTTKPLGEVKLKNLLIRYPSADERRQSFQFIVHTESSWNKRNDYVIAAQSNSEMKEWVTAFRLAGQKNTTPCATPPGSDEEATPTS